MDYKELIKIVETKRNKLYIESRSKIINKTYKEYLKKYDELLLDLYSKYENKITLKKL